MNDTISRQAAIEAIEKHIRTAEEPYQLTDVEKVMNHAFEIAASCVYNLSAAEPSAQPEQQWIPCKERKPEKSGEYWVTLIDEEGFFTDMVYWNETAGGRWEAVFVNGDGYSEIGNVIAWMPLPEPYKEDDK